VIKRIFDPAIVKEISGFEADALVNDHRNVILVKDDNLAAFAWRGPNIFEGHVEYNVRGKEAFELGVLMLKEMEKLGARIIWSLVPVNSRHARLFCRKVGFVSGGVMQTPEGLHELFALET
jgi:hypothetical protein